MRNGNTRRGSVLVMVLGMLTILFLLGSTFLVVSHMNARSANIVASTGQKEPVSEGLMAQIKSQIASGKPMTMSDGPYTGLTSNPAGWARFIDYPDDTITPWLASTDCTISGGTLTWQHMTNLNGLTSNPGPTSFTNSLTAADTDQDGKPDSLWFDTNVTNALGEKYYAAVRIVDTSGCLNYNTCGPLERSGGGILFDDAGGNSTLKDPARSAANNTLWIADEHKDKFVHVTYQADRIAELYGRIVSNTSNTLIIDPTTPVDSRAANRTTNLPVYYDIGIPYPSPEVDPTNGNWNALQPARCTSYDNFASSATNRRMLNYGPNCGQRLYDPYMNQATPDGAMYYRPFGIGDECFLRFGYNVPGNLAVAGRLNNLPMPSGTTNRTTFSSSPNISRQAGLDFPTRMTISQGTLDDDANRQFLMNQLIALGRLTTNNNDDQGKKELMHFVANLWAATSARPIDTEAFKIGAAEMGANMPAGLTAVYGVVEQLCFSEAYAYSIKTTGTAYTADGGWVRAFEIMNPTDVPILTYAPNAGDKPTYKIKCGAPSYDLPKLTINPGARIVLYTYSGFATLLNSATEPFKGGASGNLPGFPDDPPTPELGDKSVVTVNSPFNGSVTNNVWFKTAAIDNFGDNGGNPVELYREVYSGGNTIEIKADMVTPQDFGYILHTTDSTGSHPAARQDADEVGRRGQRDDAVNTMPGDDQARPATHRALVPLMKSDTLGNPDISPANRPVYGLHSLGESNRDTRAKAAVAVPIPGVTRSDFLGNNNQEVYEGFWVHRYMPGSMADLGSIYVVGPEDSSADLPHKFVATTTNATRFRLVPVPAALPSPPLPGRYPDVPAHALVSEIIALNTGDSHRADEPGAPLRIYGRVNINTATVATIADMFPPNMSVLVPTTAASGTMQQLLIDRTRAAQYVVAYRDKLSAAYFNGYPPLKRDYPSSRATAAGSNIAGLRVNSVGKGFLSAEEVAIPLADYMNELMGWNDYNGVPLVPGVAATTYLKIQGYVEARDSLYRAISNYVTVNSDTFVAHMAVQLRALDGSPRFTWYYMAAFDRGNMTLPRNRITATDVASNLIDNAASFDNTWVGRTIWLVHSNGKIERALVTSFVNSTTIKVDKPFTVGDVYMYPFDAAHPIPEPAVLMFSRMPTN